MFNILTKYFDCLDFFFYKSDLVVYLLWYIVWCFFFFPQMKVIRGLTEYLRGETTDIEESCLTRNESVFLMSPINFRTFDNFLSNILVHQVLHRWKTIHSPTFAVDATNKGFTSNNLWTIALFLYFLSWWDFKFQTFCFCFHCHPSPPS